jgi:hypothetical protein
MAQGAGTDLQALLDIEQIKQLKARYFRLMDGKRWTEMRAVFTDDFHFYMNDEPEPMADSGDAFIAHVSKVLRGSVTVHQGHMPEIELTGPTTGRGIWAMFDWVDFEKNPRRSLQGYGHYHEEYEKGGDGTWRIKRLHLTRIRVDRRPEPKDVDNSLGASGGRP